MRSCTFCAHVYLLLCRRYAKDGHGTCSDRTCTKYKNDTRDLAPGMFVLHCLKCAACVGFHIMNEAESPRTLFEVIYSRWAVPPKVVVYDNSCHGHQYFLNREPRYASTIAFLIDKLHFKGHTGCCRAYDIGLYPELAHLNSQMAEQKVCWDERDPLVGMVLVFNACTTPQARARTHTHTHTHMHTRAHAHTLTLSHTYYTLCSCLQNSKLAWIRTQSAYMFLFYVRHYLYMAAKLPC